MTHYLLTTKFGGKWTRKEFDKAIDGLANDKAPDEHGIPPNLIKALNKENRDRVFYWIVQFCDGKADYKSWHRSMLTIIDKPGQDHSDLNNWRGICIMDVISKVLCRMMNGRLFKILDKTGTRYQFGGTPNVGCREAIFTLMNICTPDTTTDLKHMSYLLT